MQLTCLRLTIIEFAFASRAHVLIKYAKHKQTIQTTFQLSY